MTFRIRLFMLSLMILVPASGLAQNAPRDPLLAEVATQCRPFDVSLRRPLSGDQEITIDAQLYYNDGTRPQDHPVPTHCTIAIENDVLITPVRLGEDTAPARERVALDSCTRAIPGVIHSSQVVSFNLRGNAPLGSHIAVHCEFLDVSNICDHLHVSQLRDLLAPHLDLAVGPVPFGGCAQSEITPLAHFVGRTKDDSHDSRGRSVERREAPTPDAPAPETPAPRRERRDPPRASDARCEAGDV